MSARHSVTSEIVSTIPTGNSELIKKEIARKKNAREKLITHHHNESYSQKTAANEDRAKPYSLPRGWLSISTQDNIYGSLLQFII